MTHEDKELLLYKIDAEGFDYCFNGYSSWEDINDENFHKLRLAYVKAQNELKQYIKKCKPEN
ncbi:hypothetical protein SAMN04488128_103235 [Chitinophaga eiseniae]|uniref:Uncharacterized protein n=1 Tax=Chitinophaga eiseniae TaxID=634771 RepID=A0A1T4SPP6_9BACT|nr:hypothetical protein SAMN04488128_103235 [Chitinophaga eiseniae]